MKRRKINNIIVTTLVICIFSVMTVFAITYTILDPVITETSTQTRVNMKIDLCMNASSDAGLLLNITPYYSLRGSAGLTADTTKEISSYSGRVVQLKGSVTYSNAVDSYKTYMKYIQKGYTLVSGNYVQVATKTTNVK